MIKLTIDDPESMALEMQIRGMGIGEIITNGEGRGAAFGRDMSERKIGKRSELEVIADHRFLLWDDFGGPAAATPVDQMLVCIGVNPSTATPFALDNTVTKVDHYARTWSNDGGNFGGWVMLNLHSFRATNPLEMKAKYDPTGDPVNITIIEAFCARAAMVLCAWGNHGAHMDRGTEVLQTIRQFREDLHVLALNKTGTPMHPQTRGLNTKDLLPQLWTPELQPGDKIYTGE